MISKKFFKKYFDFTPQEKFTDIGSSLKNISKKYDQINIEYFNFEIGAFEPNIKKEIDKSGLYLQIPHPSSDHVWGKIWKSIIDKEFESINDNNTVNSIKNYIELLQKRIYNLFLKKN